MHKIILAAALVSITGAVMAQSNQQVYRQRALLLYQNAFTIFYDSSLHCFKENIGDTAADKKPVSYLWPLCALLQTANEMEALFAGKKYIEPAAAVIKKYYSAKLPHPGYESYPPQMGGDARFYDDNQWIGIAYMDAYSRTKNKDYLALSKEIYGFMLTGYDSISGGGLYWKEFDSTTKNTCSNGPGILLALQLYNATHQQKYLDTALLLYQWTYNTLYSPDGLFYDNIQLPSGKIDTRYFTYNAGTMLQSNVMLYKITNHKKYLLAAQSLAEKSLQHFFKNNLFPDNYWFNAVLLRGYQALLQVDKQKKYIAAFKKYADKIWATQIKNGLVGQEKINTLIDQAGYAEILARLAGL